MRELAAVLAHLGGIILRFAYLQVESLILSFNSEQPADAVSSTPGSTPSSTVRADRPCVAATPCTDAARYAAAGGGRCSRGAAWYRDWDEVAQSSGSPRGHARPGAAGGTRFRCVCVTLRPVAGDQRAQVLTRGSWGGGGQAVWRGFLDRRKLSELMEDLGYFEVGLRRNGAEPLHGP